MKNLLLLVSITIGIFFPYGHKFTFLIRYFLMALLFFSFLDIKIDKTIISVKHFIILVSLIGASFLSYLAIYPFDKLLAQTAFITAIAPTAIAAPVIISLKKGKVEFTLFSLVLTNIVITIILPFILPLIINSGNDITFNDILLPVLVTFSTPLILARLVKAISVSLWKKLIDLKDGSFYILVVNVYLATSGASYYIRNNLTSELSLVYEIGIVTALICAFLFTLGWFIGGKEYASEASQALGQKNNSYTIWLAITFMNPVSVLGPVFYVLFQNTYISLNLYYHSRKQSPSD
ncbi:hypothetical protein ACSSWA_04805 [Melioribacter sp. Ez-97]|uniref:hypothetical protein n=1 Tax=Melioribacter sp. Ez-97 TaxID=3423434 RepID=UPI003ED8A92E